MGNVSGVLAGSPLFHLAQSGWKIHVEVIDERDNIDVQWDPEEGWTSVDQGDVNDDYSDAWFERWDDDYDLREYKELQFNNIDFDQLYRTLMDKSQVFF